MNFLRNQFYDTITTIGVGVVNEQKNNKKNEKRKNTVNPLEELLIIIKQYFPKLTNWIDNLTDARHQSYITYDFKICLLIQMLAFCSSYQSMNIIGIDFNSDIVINNINIILKTNFIELPHKDTLINAISQIKFEELEDIQTNIIKTLIRLKILDKYRFNGLFYIVINEYTLYSYYALEAKLVCGNMTFSLATEFAFNETYTDKHGNTYRKFDKQDCIK